MLPTLPQKRFFLARLLVATVILFALLMASCCPPALLERKPKEVRKAIKVEKSKLHSNNFLPQKQNSHESEEPFPDV